MKYQIVISFIFPNGDESYVIWEPLMYGDMIDKGVDFNTLFFDCDKTGFISPPLEVHIGLYLDPKIQEISQKWGDNEVIRELLIGRKVLHLKSL